MQGRELVMASTVTVKAGRVTVIMNRITVMPAPVTVIASRLPVMLTKYTEMTNRLWFCAKRALFQRVAGRNRKPQNSLKKSFPPGPKVARMPPGRPLINPPSAMTESSYTDRLQHAQSLHDVISNLTPAYSPGAPKPGALDLRLPGYLTRVLQVSNLNDAAEDATTLYGDKATDRAAHLTTVLAAATSVLAYLRTDKKTFATLLKGAEKIINRMRGPKSKKAPPPPPGEPPPPAKERNKGQQSYMEQQGHLRTLVNLLSNKPDYTPPDVAPAVQHPGSLGNLNGLLSSFRAFNSQISQLDADLIHAENERLAAFEHKTTGLHAHFNAVKDAVQSQYGFAGTQYGEVSGIEW